MRLLPCGDAAVLAEYAGLGEVQAHHAALAENPADGVLDLVPAERTVLVRFDPRRTSADAVARWLGEVRPVAGRHRPAEEVLIPVTYDGPDLEQVAAGLGWAREELVRRHTALTWRAAFAGFAPGFAYLVPEGEWPQVPRRDDPRTRVPAGSLGLAGGYSGVYPTTSPGGWQLVGRTELALWDLDRDPPALLAPGTAVRFVEVR